MVTIKDLIEIEEILLKCDNGCRYLYSLDELITSDKLIKEIGEITNLYFTVQVEYAKTLNKSDKEDFERKLVEYKDKLSKCQLNVDISSYIDFIKKIEHKVEWSEHKQLINDLMTKQG